MVDKFMHVPCETDFRMITPEQRLLDGLVDREGSELLIASDSIDERSVKSSNSVHSICDHPRNCAGGFSFIARSP